jgi:hypothetical protein
MSEYYDTLKDESRLLLRDLAHILTPYSPLSASARNCVMTAINLALTKVLLGVYITRNARRQKALIETVENGKHNIPTPKCLQAVRLPCKPGGIMLSCVPTSADRVCAPDYVS